MTDITPKILSNEEVADKLFQYLKDLLYNSKNADLKPDEFPKEFQNLVQGMVFVGNNVLEAKRFANDISVGNLNTKVPPTANEFASPLKSLHSNINHMIWQTKQISKGDYSQRVSFLGEFSDAINTMTDQLEENRTRLIEENRNKLHSLETLAYHDPLTGLTNRHYAMDLLACYTEEKRDFILCFVDIDKLKYVNDVFGHNEGDKYIMSIGNILKSFSSSCHVSRLGGDEYVLIDQKVNKKAADDRLELLRAEIKGIPTGEKYIMSFSYGVIHVLPVNTKTTSELLSEADETMYEYKKEHKQERRSEI